jgi:hypothetical protein
MHHNQQEMQHNQRAAIFPNDCSCQCTMNVLDYCLIFAHKNVRGYYCTFQARCQVREQYINGLHTSTENVSLSFVRFTPEGENCKDSNIAGRMLCKHDLQLNLRFHRQLILVARGTTRKIVAGMKPLLQTTHECHLSKHKMFWHRKRSYS